MTRRQAVFVYLVWTVLTFQNVIGNPCQNLEADYYDGKCFKVFWDQVLKGEAEAMCQSWISGGRLAEPRTNPQLMFLSHIAKRDNTNKALHSIVIAGGRETPTSNLTWPDGEPVNFTYWITSNNPDNSEGVEQCIELLLPNTYLPNDVRCDANRSYACEYPVGDICESHMSGSECFGGQCFKIHHQPASWDDAISTCAQDGAFLAEPKTEKMYGFLTMFVRVNLGPEENGEFLIGLTDNHEEGVFRWLSDNEVLELDKWHAGEPNNTGSQKHVVISSAGKDLLHVDANSISYPFICQKDVLAYTYLAVVPADLNKIQTVATLTITSSNPEITFVRIIQADGLPTGSTKVYTYTETVPHLGQGSFVTLNGFSYINVSGISSSFVEVKSTEPVTILMYIEIYSPSKELTDLASTLILPTNLLAQNYFVTSHSVSMEQKILTVTALENNTNVTIKMPSEGNHKIIVTVGRIEYQPTHLLYVSLNKYETALIETTDMAGCFVYGTKPVAVFTKTKMVINAQIPTSNIALDMLLPTDYMGTKYVTFPAWPHSNASVTSTQSVDKIQLLAIRDNTVVKVHDKDIQNIALSKTSDIDEVSLSVPKFYYMESNVPFHASRLSSDAAVGCTSQLIPSSLWRTEYNVMMSASLPADMQKAVLFIIAEEKIFNASFSIEDMHCQTIQGSNLHGCVLGPDIIVKDEVYTISSPLPFVVYQAWIDDSQRTRSCFPWGIDYLGAANVVVDFDGEKYVNQNDSSCVLPTNVMDDLTTTVADDLTTIEDLTTVGHSSLPSTAYDDTTTMTNDIHSTTELNIPAEVEKFKAYVREELYLADHDTLAYRRSKISVPDSRVSSVVIGLFGAALMTLFLGFFMFADVERLVSYLCGKIKPKTEKRV